ASQAIELLPPEQRTKYAPRLQRVLLDIQEPDGATWDMFLADFTRCYGTAYSIMSLQRTLGPRQPGTCRPRSFLRLGRLLRALGLVVRHDRRGRVVVGRHRRHHRR